MRPIEHVTNMYKQLYSLLVYTTNTIGFSVVRVARPEHGPKPCPTVAQEAIPTLIPPGISITGYTRYSWKKENKPLSVVVGASTPTASPHVTYRESHEPSIGESSSEKEDEEDPFNKEEKESQLKYIADVHIPTIEQAAEDKKAAEIISTLSLKTETTPLPLLPTFTVPFTLPKFSPIFTASIKKPEMASSTPKTNKMKFKSPPILEGKQKDLNNFLAKCNLDFNYQGEVSPKEKILFVMYLLDGLVTDWRNTKVTEYNKTPTKWNNYDAFTKELKDTWGEVDESGMALHRLFHFKKFAKTPLNEYV